jgi:hypothetical protein
MAEFPNKNLPVLLVCMYVCSSQKKSNVMKKVYFLKAFFLTLLIVGLGFNASAQLNYLPTGITNTLGSYSDLGTAGTPITVANADSANSAPQNIGFTFQYNGLSFTQFVLNTNGFIKLGNTDPSTPNLSLINAVGSLGAIESLNPADANILCVVNTDMEAGPGGVEFRVNTTGTAPNRVTTIQFKGMQDKTVGTALPQFSNIQFQIRLFETSNIIEYVFGAWTPITLNADAFKLTACGLKGSSFSTGNFISATKGSVTAFSAVTGTASWLNTAPLAGNRFNIRRTAGPDAGRTFRFTPVPPCTGTPTVNIPALREVCFNAPVTISPSGTSVGPGISYQWQESSNATAWVNSTLPTATSLALTVPSVTTERFYRLQVTCTNSSQTATSGACRVFSTTLPIASLPYAQGFDGISALPLPCGWGRINSGTSNWDISTFTSFNTPNSLLLFTAENPGGGPQNDWVVSPGFVLDTGKLYKITHRYRLNTAETQRMRVWLGKGQTQTAFTRLLDTIVPSNAQFAPNEVTFTVTARDTFNVGFQNATLFNTGQPTNMGIFFDGFVIEEVFTNDATVTEVIGAGKISTGSVNQNVMFANIRNVGLSPITGMVPTLEIRGANPQTLNGPTVTLSPGNTSFVAFPGYVSNNTGIDTVIIRVAADQNNTNDRGQFLVQATANDYHIHEFGALPTQGFIYGAASGAFDVFFANRFPITGPNQTIVLKVRVNIPNSANLIGVPVSGIVKNAAGVILGQSATRAITAADLGTNMEFNINQVFPVVPFAPGSAVFAGIAMNKPAGEVSVPVTARPEPTNPGRPIAPSYNGSPFNAAPSENAGRLYMIEIEVANASAPNRISPFNLSSPANGTIVNLQGSASTTANIAWRRAFDTAGLNISYQFLLDQLGFDFSAPVVQAPSNNNGSDTALTLTYEIIDDILDDAGAPLDSSDIDMIWTVRAIAGANAKLAQDTFDIVFRRFGLQYTLCTPNNTGNSNDFIDSVRFTGAAGTSFTNQTGRNVPSQYIDFFNDLSKAVSVNQGASYPFSVRMGALPVVDTFDHQAIVLVDWNKNGRFDDMNGRFVTNVAPSFPTVGALLTGNLVIPSGIPNDRYRMRVIGGDTAGFLEPCVVDFGDIEDYSLFVGIPVGIELTPALEASLLSLYPNPTTGMLQVQYPFSKQRDVTVQVFNSVGALVYNRLDAGVTNNESFIDLSSYSEGVYMVKFITSDATEVRRVVLQK